MIDRDGLHQMLRDAGEVFTFPWEREDGSDDEKVFFLNKTTCGNMILWFISYNKERNGLMFTFLKVTTDNISLSTDFRLVDVSLSDDDGNLTDRGISVLGNSAISVSNITSMENLIDVLSLMTSLSERVSTEDTPSEAEGIDLIEMDTYMCGESDLELMKKYFMINIISDDTIGE